MVLHLSAGQLELLNVKFLVADGYLSTGDFIIGHPLLQHLRVDTRTLLEENRAALDGTDCSDVQNITAGQHKSRQVGGLTNVTQHSADITSRKESNRPRANYYLNRANDDE